MLCVFLLPATVVVVRPCLTPIVSLPGRVWRVLSRCQGVFDVCCLVARAFLTLTLTRVWYWRKSPMASHCRTSLRTQAASFRWVQSIVVNTGYEFKVWLKHCLHTVEFSHMSLLWLTISSVCVSFLCACLNHWSLLFLQVVENLQPMAQVAV